MSRELIEHVHVEEGVTPAGNQQPQSQDLTPKRSRRTYKGYQIPGAKRKEQGQGVGESGYNAREPAKQSVVEAGQKTGMESGGRIRKRRGTILILK